MILNEIEKEQLVTSLSWMITDMKHRHDEIKGDIEVGSQGDYSDELKATMLLLDVVEKTETVETTGYHRKATSLNCREFRCTMSRQGICISTKVTLESTGSLLVGRLICEEAEKKEEEDIS